MDHPRLPSFAVLVQTPGELEHAHPALAAVKAGGVGILSLTHTPEALLPRAASSLEPLRALAASLHQDTTAIGLRCRPGQLPAISHMLTALAGVPHLLILEMKGEMGRENDETTDGSVPSPADTTTLVDTLPSLAPGGSRLLLAAIGDAAQATAAPWAQGIVAMGNESGGFPGSQFAFILAQQCLRDIDLPILVQGGIGPHTAAACRAGGAAGVVLDEQVLLLAESPLPPAWQTQVAAMEGKDAMLLGDPLGTSAGLSCRVALRPPLGGANALRQSAAQWESQQGATNQADAQSRQAWAKLARKQVTFGDPATCAWPMGQAVEMAATWRERYKTTGRFVHAILKQSEAGCRAAAVQEPLAQGAPLAQSLGTAYPITQGPMANVSDSPAFLAKVAEAGALPFLALSWSDAEAAQSLLSRTGEALGDRPFGVGMLGFLEPDRLAPQMELVKAARPACVILAGGRPDQVRALEAAGIPSFIHTPTPGILKLYLKQEVTRLVLEGRECGGHIGPLSSFVLWEAAMDALLHEVKPAAQRSLQVLFAGGIHDGRSAAMVAAMAAPLVERGMQIGAQLGTAYLFTREALETGAVSDAFQRQALACDGTAILDEGIGHASRCASTPFVKAFASHRASLLREGASASTMQQSLSSMLRGRLRMATRNLSKDEEGQAIPVPEDLCLAEGVYMMGQLAALMDAPLDMATLHQAISRGASEYLEAYTDEAELAGRTPPPLSIAIVGMASLLPGATLPETFWRNLLDAKNCVTEIPFARWDSRLLYDADKSAQDKSYSRWGGFFEPISFDPLRYGIPPNSMKSISVGQLLSLEVARWALEDAGYAPGTFDGERTGVIFANGDHGGLLSEHLSMRSNLPFLLDTPYDGALDRMAPWTEEAFAGSLSCIASGRIANRFDLGGPNFTVDAACASSLAALDQAVKELAHGSSDMMLAGALDVGQTPFGYVAFSKTQALSSSSSARVFDKAADGIIISEGVAVLVLKRLEDAERDGDKIYAVIKATAGSSDGRALGMTAPHPRGQLRSLHRAYEQAGFSPATLGLLEAHGTGTPVGDRAEAETVTRLLAHCGTPAKQCHMGSLKSLIGHPKTAAGMAALVKMSMALRHKTIPPHVHPAGDLNPLDALADSQSPVDLPQAPKPWLAQAGTPRRAGVSSFGFGGTNFHAVLEEYTGNLKDAPLGAAIWPAELCVLLADDQDALQQACARLLDALTAGAAPRLSDLAYSLADAASQQEAPDCGLYIVARTLDEFTVFLRAALRNLQGVTDIPVPPGVFLASGLQVKQKAAKGRVAFLFPGQGSQYPDMALEASLYQPELRQALETADDVLQDAFPTPLSRAIFPPAAFTPADQTARAERLKDSHLAQPALGAVSAGLFQFLQRLGINPDMAAGHSYGEYAALHAGGAMDLETLLRISEIRGRLMAQQCDGHGAMAAIMAPRHQVETALAEFEAVVLANHNGPTQSVISGERRQVRRFVERMEQAGVRAVLLPVAGAFHSFLMEGAAASLSEALDELELHHPTIPVYSNVTAAPFAHGPEEDRADSLSALRGVLSRHLLSPVAFMDQIEAMYADGARIFVEVGPKAVLTGLVRRILGERASGDFIPTDDCPGVAIGLEEEGATLREMLTAVARLAKAGVPVAVEALFRSREVQLLNLERLVETTRPEPPSPTSWLVDGCHMRPIQDSSSTWGSLPFLNADSPRYEMAPTAHAQPPLLQSEPARSSTTLTAGALPLEAYAHYQETMRQFLALQEDVMRRVLGGEAPAALPTLPQPASLVPSPPATPPNLAHAATAPPALAAASSPLPAQPQAPSITEASSVSNPSPIAAAPRLLDTKAILTALTNHLADMTGYPPAMLQGEIDLEAELGIDSIKRMELLTFLGSILPEAAAVALRDRMEEASRHKTLAAVADLAGEVLAASPAASSSPGIEDAATQAASPSTVAPPARTLPEAPLPAADADATCPLAQAAPAAQSDGVVLDHAPAAALRSRITDLLSLRTGYPASSLDPHLDLEAELGVDSIKRLELLETLLGAFSPLRQEALRQHMSELSAVKSIQALSEALAQQGTQPPSPPQAVSQAPPAPTAAGNLEAPSTPNTAEAPAKTAVPNTFSGNAAPKSPKHQPIRQEALPELDADDAEEDSNHCPRYVVRPMREPLPRIPLSRPQGLFLITDDGHGAAAWLSNALQERGAATRLLDRSILADPAALADTLSLPANGDASSSRAGTPLRARPAPVRGIIHLAPLAPGEQPTTLAAFRERTQLEVKSFFSLLHAHAPALQEDGPLMGRALVATRLGGAFGRTALEHGPGSGFAPAGGCVGLLKTLDLEMPRVLSKAIDFDDGLTHQEMAEAVLRELLMPGGELEIGYIARKRHVFPVHASPVPDAAEGIASMEEWVVLATGGGRGITAHCLEKMARPGMRIILTGRSPVPAPEEPATAALPTVQTLRQHLAMRSPGETQSPRAIEAQVQRILANRAMQETVQRLQARGAAVEYHQADVVDEAAMRQVVTRILATHGRIDAAIHGAGIIEDKRIHDKEPASFARVFDVKVDGAFVLTSVLPMDSLRLLVFFGSTAGRFGNVGQGDYATANEALNRMAWQTAAQWPQLTVKTINWGPWKGGMATPALNRRFRKQGIVPIAIEAGASFMEAEIVQAHRRDVEVVAGEGPWRHGILNASSLCTDYDLLVMQGALP